MVEALAPYEPVAEPEPAPAKPKRAKVTRATKPRKAAKVEVAPVPDVPATASDEDDDWAGYEIEYADTWEPHLPSPTRIGEGR